MSGTRARTSRSGPAPQVASRSARRARIAAELRRLDPAPLLGPAGLHDWLKLFRVHQWTKNGARLRPRSRGASLHAVGDHGGRRRGGVLLARRIRDLRHQRPRRRRIRPQASQQEEAPARLGNRPGRAGSGVRDGFPRPRFALALALSLPFAAVLATYLVATIAYSFWLKRKMMVDIVTLASLYTLRVIGGAAAVKMMPSEWIIAFSMFIFTSLALLKRYVELTGRIDASLPDPPDRNYRKTDVPMLGALAAGSGLNAVTVFALYISSDTVHRLYRHPLALWLICPILMYWIGRALIMAERRLIDDDPIKFALRDRVSLLAVALIAFIMIAAA